MIDKAEERNMYSAMLDQLAIHQLTYAHVCSRMLTYAHVTTIRHSAMLDELGIDQPAWAKLAKFEDAQACYSDAC